MNLKKLLLPVALSIAALFIGTNKAEATTCPNATAITASLPIVNQALVCGTTDDITSSNTVVTCGNTDYYGGQEALYTYTPTANQTVTISYNGVTYVGIFVFAGCPTTTGTTCTGNTTSSGTSKSLTVTLTAGVTYYIMFDTWPTPNSPCPGTFSMTSCQAPTALAAGSVTTTSASLSFTGTASNYQLVYGTSSTLGNASNTRVTTTASPYAVSGLTQSTTYYSWIRSICAAGDTSVWSSSINFATPAACVAPVGVIVNNLATTSATLNWTASTTTPAPSYAYEVRTSGAAGSGTTGLVTSGTSAAGVTTVNVTGLTLSTTYTVYVRSNCGAVGFSTWSTAVTFATTCNAITTFPFIDTFVASGLPACWTAANSGSSTVNWTGATADASYGVAAPYASTAFLRLNVYSAATGSNPYILNSRPYALSGTLKQLQYYYFLGNAGYKGTTGAAGSDPFPMIILGTKDGGTTYDTLFKHSAANSILATSSAVSNWTLNSIVLPASYVGQTVQFRIVSRSNFASGTTNQALDEFTVNDAPACQSPTGVAATAITSSGATLTWTTPASAPSNGYQYEVRTSGAAGSGTTGLATSGTTAAGTLTANATGLAATTTYRVYLRSDCGTAVGNSTWILGTTFTTPCAIYTLPFAENFATVPPNCWSLATGFLSAAASTPTTTTSNSWASDQYLNNSANGPAARINLDINSKKDWLISPSINLGTGGSYLLGFNVGVIAYSSLTSITSPVGTTLGSDDTLAVLVSTNNGASWSKANAVRTFTAANTPLNATGNQRYTVGLSGITGQVKIAFYASEGTVDDAPDNDVFVDSVTLVTCTPPVVALGNDTSFCAGNTITFNAGNTGATYLWSTGATTQTISVATSGTYNVRVTNASGCVGIDTVVVTVNPLPIVNLGNDTSFCTGNSISLNAGNAGSTYLWSTGATTQTVVAATTGSYSVRVINANGCIGRDTINVSVTNGLLVNLGNDTSFCAGNSVTLNPGNPGAAYLWSTGAITQTITASTAGTYSVQVTNASGCTGRDTINVTVNPLPVVNLGNDTSFCIGNTITLNAGNAGATYLWSTSDTTQTVMVSTAGTYSVRVTNSNGCIRRDTLIVTINPLPVVNLGVDKAICAGNSVTLNAGNAGATYLWSTGDITRTVAASTAGNYSVRVTNTNGCVGRDTVAVTVNPLPVVNLGNDTSFCAGGTVTLNAGNAGASYLWSTGATTQTVTASTVGTYSVRVTNSNGCIGRDTVEVSVNALPVVKLGKDTVVCIGSFVALNADNAGSAYLWSTGATSQTISVGTTGTYSVRVTNAFGCIGRDTINVGAIPRVVAGTITVTGQSPAYIFTINGNQNDSRRAWDFGDGLLDTTSQLKSTGHVYNANGTYTVTFYAINDCSIDSVKTTVKVVPVSVNNVTLDGQLTLFPNPASEFVTIKNTSNQDMKHIMVLNVLGAVVSETDATNGKEQRINISGLATGSYLIRVQLNGTTVVRRLQITK